jgi:hypothetical protein
VVGVSWIFNIPSLDFNRICNLAISSKSCSRVLVSKLLFPAFPTAIVEGGGIILLVVEEDVKEGEDTEELEMDCEERGDDGLVVKGKGGGKEESRGMALGVDDVDSPPLDATGEDKVDDEDDDDDADAAVEKKDETGGNVAPAWRLFV